MARMEYFVVFVCSIFVTTFAANEYTNYTELDGEYYKVWWRYENSSDRFYFKVEVAAKGWIGFGFTLLNQEAWMRGAMMKYDVLVAGVYYDGNPYSEDYLTAYLNTSQAPHIDEKNNWNITSAKEEGGKTTLEFNRKRKTNDPMNVHRPPFKGDIEITPGERNFVWAYHMSKDTPYLNHTSLKHTKSGLQKVTLIKEDFPDPVSVTGDPAVKGKFGQASTIVPAISTLGTLIWLIFICLY